MRAITIWHFFRQSAGTIVDAFTAEDSRNVFFGKHARERMEERGISDRDVRKVINEGDIIGPIEVGKATGEWKCKIVARIKGNREAGVVTVATHNCRLFIKTVEWEDL